MHLRELSRVVLTLLWALMLGGLFGLWVQRQHAADFVHLPPGAWRATSEFARAIGDASEMTLLAQRQGTRTDLVAAAHSVRLVIAQCTTTGCWARPV